MIPNPEFTLALAEKLPWGWETGLQGWGTETRGSNKAWPRDGKTTAQQDTKAEPRDWIMGNTLGNTEGQNNFLPKFDVWSSRDLVTGGEKGSPLVSQSTPAFTSSPLSSGSPSPVSPSPALAFSCLGIGGSRLGEGQWFASLPPREPGQEYLFTDLFYQHLSNTPSYPVVSIWGQQAVLDSHWMADKFQPLRTYVSCPDKIEDSTFRLINELPPRQVWMGKPSPVKHVSKPPSGGHDGFFFPNSFLTGVYGASIDKLEEIKKLALNTVIIGGGGAALKKTIRECRRLGLRYVLSVPHDPERLKLYLDDLIEGGGSVESSFVEGDGAEVGFYVDDEPELRSVPINKAEEGRRRLGRVVGRLNTIYPWLLEKNLEEPVGVAMLSEYRVDPKGRAAVHAALKKKDGATMVIAVNTIGAPVKAALTFAGLRDGVAKDVFSGLGYPVVNGKLTADFLAYQTLAFVIQ